MLIGSDSETQVGGPLVAGATVAGEIVEQTRGAKVIAFKKRRRKNSKRTRGHRQLLTMVRITEILTDGRKPETTAEAPARASVPEVEAPAEAPVASEATAAAEGKADDLKKLSGVGPVLEKKLHGLGVTSFAEIAAWTPEDVAKMDEAINMKGRIERDDWVAQAKTLIADQG
jgi:large subunit ribosomal protein L21